jgi:glycosyltransferase involved in cell wall biosynthesis
MSTALYSIIIPTAVRVENLTTCLNKVLAQVHGLNSSEFEIIVSDDTGQVKAAIEEDYVQYKEIKFNLGPSKGPAANRNSGAKLAKGNWLIFTDDDCIPEPQWLEAYVNVLKNQNKSSLAFEGMILPIGGVIDEELTEGPWNPNGGHFWSANIAVWRQLFEELGGFDESYAFPDHEDIDFKNRIEEKTAITFVPEALIYHPVRRLTFIQALVATKKRVVIWTLHMLRQGNSNSILGYLKLVKYWCSFFFRHTLACIQRGQWMNVALCLYRVITGPFFIFQVLVDAKLRSNYSNN